MAGQQQLKNLNIESLYEKYSDELLTQADLFYLEEKFNLETKYNKNEFLKAFLFKDVFCTDDCEFITFFNSLHKNKKLKINKNLFKLEVEQDYNIINNYYNLEDKWDKAEW